MPLSKKRPLLVALLSCITFAAACGSNNTAPNTPSNTSANGELTKGEQAFNAKEPDVYQTEAYYSGDGSAGDKYFVARNGAMRRVDTYTSGKLAVTELIKDNNRYVIDHVRKIYYVDPPSDKGPKVVNPAAIAFFQNTQHHEFDEVSRNGDLVMYKAKKQPGDPDQDTTITMDQKTGLMVRQEVKGGKDGQSFIFELKNTTLEAPDDLFQLPAGYKQVSKDEFKPPEKNAGTQPSPRDVPNPHANQDVRKAHD
jgi:hypothetical protein